MIIQALPPRKQQGQTISVAESLERQHERYYRNSQFYKYLYYTIRLLVGLAAVLLPFILSYSQLAATCLSIVVAILTVVDTVFVPKDKWRLNSTTSDRLWLQDLKRSGEYEKYKDDIEEIIKAEHEELELATTLKELQDDLRGVQSGPLPESKPAR